MQILLLLIKREPSHLMCDRSNTCEFTFSNTFSTPTHTYTIRTWLHCNGVAEFIAVKQQASPQYTHTHIVTPLYTYACKKTICHYGSLCFMQLYCTWACQLEFSAYAMELLTNSNKQKRAQVLGSIYCRAACWRNSSRMSIRVENGSFHDISHSNELQQNFLHSHTSTHWAPFQLSETKCCYKTAASC